MKTMGQTLYVSRGNQISDPLPGTRYIIYVNMHQLCGRYVRAEVYIIGVH